MRVRTGRGTLQTLYRAVPALWPPKASQQAQQRWGPLLRWPWRRIDVAVGVGPVSEIVREAVMADETADEAADEAVSKVSAVSELGSAAEFVFDAGVVRRHAFSASELSEVAVLMVLEGLGPVQPPLV